MMYIFLLYVVHISFLYISNAETSEYSTISTYAHVAGDPHLRTFDGVEYDCMGRGEYVLSVLPSIRLRLHARFKGNGLGSVATDLALRYYSEFIQLSILENPTSVVLGECEVSVFLSRNGKPNKIQRGRHFYGKLEIELSSESIVVYMSSGSRLFTTTFRTETSGCYFVLGQLLLPASIPRRSLTRGLFGSADNNKSNEFKWPKGTTADLFNTKSTEEGTSFCRRWCVRKRRYSIFNNFTSNSDFSCGKRTITKSMQVVDNVSSEVEEVCQGNSNCLFDALVAGIRAARAYMRAIFISEVIGRDAARVSPAFSNAPVLRFWDSSHKKLKSFDSVQYIDWTEKNFSDIYTGE